VSSHTITDGGVTTAEGDVWRIEFVSVARPTAHRRQSTHVRPTGDAIFRREVFRVRARPDCSRVRRRVRTTRQLVSIGAGKPLLNFFRFGFFSGLLGFYEDRTRKCDPKADEKHPIHGTPYLTKDK